MQAVIETVGYAGVFLGVAVEGEVVVITAAYLAQEGLLSPVGIALSAFAGSLGVYHTCFWLGRRHGRAILARRPAWQARVEHAQQRIARHELPLILGYRLLFGLRAATPFALGLSGVSHGRFLLLDTPVAAIWAAGLVALGYGLGRGAERIAGQIGEVAGWFVLGLIALVIAGFMRRGWRAYRRRPRRPRRPRSRRRRAAPPADRVN